jgi:hypothetical protein
MDPPGARTRTTENLCKLDFGTPKSSELSTAICRLHLLKRLVESFLLLLRPLLNELVFHWQALNTVANEDIQFKTSPLQIV